VKNVVGANNTMANDSRRNSASGNGAAVAGTINSITGVTVSGGAGSRRTSLK
jgi:hypothetical protein